MTKTQKEMEIKPWDRRPWPLRGDADDRTVYQHVGQFLSFWERYEATLAYLFASFFGPLPLSDPARRSYFSVRTFEGRAEMLRAASSTYFDARKSPELQKRFDELLKARSYSRHGGTKLPMVLWTNSKLKTNGRSMVGCLR